MHGFLDEIFFTFFFDLLGPGDGTSSGHTVALVLLYVRQLQFCGGKALFPPPLQSGLGHLEASTLLRDLHLRVGVVLGPGTPRGACSWDYSHYPLNFMGLIILMYLPGWIFLSVYQDLLSNVLWLRCNSASN